MTGFGVRRLIGRLSNFPVKIIMAFLPRPSPHCFPRIPKSLYVGATVPKYTLTADRMTVLVKRVLLLLDVRLCVSGAQSSHHCFHLSDLYVMGCMESHPDVTPLIGISLTAYDAPSIVLAASSRKLAGACSIDGANTKHAGCRAWFIWVSSGTASSASLPTIQQEISNTDS